MGCNCGGGGSTVPMLTMAEAYARPDGTFALASQPDCEGGYRGPNEGLSVFVVGRLTALEKLFKREDLQAAGDYMNSFPTRPGIEKMATETLCRQAIVDLFGS